MSPAAVDFRSPITSPPPKSSSTAENVGSLPEVPSASTFNLGASNGNGNQCLSGPSEPSRSGRPRPRLVKLRKQHSRSRTGFAETAPGVNPFCSVSDDGTCASSNGFKFPNVDCGGVGFVFSSRRSGGDENPGNGEGGGSGKVGNLDNGERGSSEMGTTTSFDDNWDGGEGEIHEILKMLSRDERGQLNTGNGREQDKLESVSLECGANHDDLGSSSCGAKEEFCEDPKRRASEDEGNGKAETNTESQKVDSMSFVFGSNSSGLGLGSDSSQEMRKKECGGYLEKSTTDNSGKLKSNNEVEECNVGSGPGASQRGLAPNLSTGNGESASFVFAAGPNTSASTPYSGNRECTENEGKSGGDSTKVGDEAEVRKYNNTGFVFGSSWSSYLNLDSGNKNPFRNLENLAPDFGNNMKVESETDFGKMKADPFELHAKESCISNKDHDKGCFVFGSNGKEGSSFNECKIDKCQDEMKPSSKNLGDCKTNSGSNSSGQGSGGLYIPSDRSGGDDNESSDQNHILFGGDSNTTCAARGKEGNVDSVHACRFLQCETDNNKFPSVASTPYSSSSTGFNVQPNGCVSESASVGEVKKNDENNVTGTPGGFGVCFEDLKTPFWDPYCLRESLFPELNKTSELSVKGRAVQETKSMKQRVKSKRPSVTKQRPGQDHVPKESSSQKNPDPSGCYSPMDFSPYEETKIADPCSSENSVASPDNNGAPCASNSTVPDLRGEDLAAAGSGLDGDHASSISGAAFDLEDPRAGSCLNTGRQESDCRTPLFASGIGNVKEDKDFMFFASSPLQSSTTMAKRQQRRKKYRMKAGQETFVLSPSPNIVFGSSDANEQSNEVHISSSNPTREICEKWRIRGNEAYKNGELSDAEEFYTQGIISIPSNERSGCSLQPLLICYSNRAITRICLGRIREALGDCVMATALDPNFVKVQMRAANCHLLLGEVENAQKYFNKCLEPATGVCLDRRIVIDSADGLQRVQKVVECTDHSAKLLDQRTTDAALTALEKISEALSISLYSEKLLEMKTEALCLLRRYEEAVQLCEQSLVCAEKNLAPLNNVEKLDSSGCEFYPVRLWRWFFISKSYFHLGRLEAALNLLEKLEKAGPSRDMYTTKKLESSVSLAVTIRELLSHKNAGNEAFRSGRYTEAVEHYTVALSSNIGSRPFSAICLCNRAAAHQASGQITNAIADCSLAIALDGNYVKAVSRRATLHEKIRDYEQAASDLQRLISILENQSDDKAKESSSQGRSNGSEKELRIAHRRMPLMEEEAKKGIALDFYLILGTQPSDESSDIKKAYRKAALKHHPDKAGQFLARSESADEGQIWKEISLEVQKDADRLFKMIGEAYTVLSDPAKRSQYDLEEEMRKVEIENKESRYYRKSSPAQSPRGSYRSGFHSSPFERSSYSRTYGRENWKTYGNSYSKW